MCQITDEIDRTPLLTVWKYLKYIIHTHLMGIELEKHNKTEK